MGLIPSSETSSLPLRGTSWDCQKQFTRPQSVFPREWAILESTKKKKRDRLCDPKRSEAMQTEKLAMEHIRAALSAEGQKLKELMDAIELNDMEKETVMVRVRQIEQGLRRLRQAA
jgi:hypothetical protein